MKKYHLLIGFIVLTVSVISCKRKGCTNLYCDNYEEKAKKDDGSCDCNDGVLSVYIANDYGAVEVYLDNSLVGSINNYFPDAEPRCAQDGTLILDFATGTYSLEASSQSGKSWTKTISVTEGQCTLLELE